MDGQEGAVRVTLLGTGSAEGCPHAFCGCAACERARALGGPYLRRRSAALVDGELLIDLGPDVASAAGALGLSLAGVRWCLQTHDHADHLDAQALISRTKEWGVPDPATIELVASEGTLASVAALVAANVPLGPAGLVADAAARLNLRLRPIAAGETVAVGPYRVTAVPASHGAAEPLLFAIAPGQGQDRDGPALFYATDTGPLSDAAWETLARLGGRFGAVLLDHTLGSAGPSEGHLTAGEFRDLVARLRDAGLLVEGCRVFAHHVAPHGNPPHPEFVAEAAAHGYEVPFDGQVVEV